MDWHDRGLKTPDQINEFLESRKTQVNNEKNLKKQVKKENFEQREYQNLSFLYANNNIKEDANG